MRSDEFGHFRKQIFFFWKIRPRPPPANKKIVPDGPAEHIFEAFLPVPDGPAEHIFEDFLPVPDGPAEHIFESFLPVPDGPAGTFLKAL